VSHGRLEAVLLDMGGVLIPEVTGFEGAVERAELLEALLQLGIPEPDAFVLETGQRLRQAYRAEAASHSQPDPEAVFAELEPGVRRLLLDAFAREETQPAYPHARAIVAELAQRFQVGLVSNTIVPGDHHARALDEVGILELLDASVWSANFGTRKPSPAIIEHVLERLGVGPSNAILVGDKIRTDVLGARSAGVRSVWLRLDGARNTGEAVPDFVIDDLRELPALLDRLFPR
jgi:HAD superfamily hydrolase (TIGR01509 family)